MQGLMWRAYNEFGFLEYAFSEVVQAQHPYYIIRALGGLLFLAGTLVMAFNLWKTIRSGAPVAAPAPVAALAAGAAE
jgi:cytochrome c oxidase cbb3-type subunit 1